MAPKFQHRGEKNKAHSSICNVSIGEPCCPPLETRASNHTFNNMRHSIAYKYWNIIHVLQTLVLPLFPILTPVLKLGNGFVCV